MKKILPFLMAILLILCVGCRNMSADTYIYDSGVSDVEDIVSAIESEITEKENAGEVTASRETSEYTDQGNDIFYGEIGKQNVIVDSGIGYDDALQIKQADVNTNGAKPLYYSYLSDTQKQIYRFMKSAADNMTEGLFLVGAVSGKESNRLSDITVAFRAVSCDNPQIFWLPNSYITSPDGSAVAFSYHKNGYDIDYNVSSNKRDSEQKKLNDLVTQIVSEAKKLGSRFEEELYFHDWLCENVDYGKDGTENIYTAYGALVNGTAVCEGYSRAMQLLCDSAGITCTVVYGHSNGIGHMWNIINSGDGWYNLDVTWDDDAEHGVIRHAYFNVSDSVIKDDHTPFDAIADGKSYVSSDYFNIHLYNCGSMNYNYFEKKDLIFTDDMTHNACLVANALKSSQTQIEVMYKNSNTDYKSVLNELNNEIQKQDVYVSGYSNLGNAIVLWLTFFQ